MSEQLNIKFTSKPWKVTPWQASSDLSHDTAGADYVFDSPDMKGKGTGSYVVTYIPDDSSAGDGKKDGNGHFAFDGQVLFEGTIKGRQGAVMLRERGHAKDGAYESEWVWFPESGSGQLQGTAGEASVKVAKGQQGKAVAAQGEVSFP